MKAWGICCLCPGTESRAPMTLLRHILRDRTSTRRRKWPRLIVPCLTESGRKRWVKTRQFAQWVVWGGCCTCAQEHAWIDARTYWNCASVCISTGFFLVCSTHMDVSLQYISPCRPHHLQYDRFSYIYMTHVLLLFSLFPPWGSSSFALPETS